MQDQTPSHHSPIQPPSQKKEEENEEEEEEEEEEEKKNRLLFTEAFRVAKEKEHEIKQVYGFHSLYVGVKYEKGERTDKIAIVVHVKEKLPPDSVYLHPDPTHKEYPRAVPRYYDHIPTDVVQHTEFEFFYAPKNKDSPEGEEDQENEEKKKQKITSGPLHTETTLSSSSLAATQTSTPTTQPVNHAVPLQQPLPTHYHTPPGFYAPLCAYHTTLSPGCMIHGSKSAGSIGYFVHVAAKHEGPITTGNYLLTCSHVVPQDHVYPHADGSQFQPPQPEQTLRCGRGEFAPLSTPQNKKDFSFCSFQRGFNNDDAYKRFPKGLYDKIGTQGQFKHITQHGIPSIVSAIALPVSNQRVFKYGCKTGYTCGRIDAVSLDGSFSVSTPKFTASEFAQPGDSGSLMVGLQLKSAKLVAFGIVVGGKPHEPAWAYSLEKIAETVGTITFPHGVGVPRPPPSGDGGTHTHTTTTPTEQGSPPSPGLGGHTHTTPTPTEQGSPPSPGHGGGHTHTSSSS